MCKQIFPNRLSHTSLDGKSSLTDITFDWPVIELAAGRFFSHVTFDTKRSKAKKKKKQILLPIHFHVRDWTGGWTGQLLTWLIVMFIVMFIVVCMAPLLSSSLLLLLSFVWSLALIINHDDRFYFSLECSCSKDDVNITQQLFFVSSQWWWLKVESETLQKTTQRKTKQT